MGVLKKKGGRLELDGREVKEGDAIELQLSGVWTKGSLRPSESLGLIFVADSGEQSFVGLEGAAARLPGSGQPGRALEDAYTELIVAAGHAAAALKLVQQAAERLPEQPGTRTLQRLLNALYVIRELRGREQELTA